MHETLNQELSDYIKLLRFKKKYSQEEVAKKIGITRNTYSIWENKPVALSLETLVNLFDVFEEDALIFFKKYVAKSNEQETQKEKEE